MTNRVQNLHVLIVDDYRTTLRIIDSLLKQIGFQYVDQATDGQMALEKLKNGRYDLIISDWTMAPMSGLELLKDVRADKRFQDIPFLMVTGENHLANLPEAEHAGMNDYIIKPFNVRLLKDKLMSILGKF